MSGEDLVDAQPGFDSRTNEPIISFRFNQSGARKFGSFTKDNVGAPFAIVLDNKVLSAPVIREPILGGSGQISGSFTVESANNARRSAALRLAAGQADHRRGAHRRSLARRRLASRPASSPASSAVSPTAILTIVAYGTFGVFAVIGLLVHGFLIIALMTHHRHDADAARHRRLRADHRHGGRRQRAHLRAHPRGAAHRQVADRGHRRRASSAPSSPSSTASSRRLLPPSSCSGSAPVRSAASP